MTLSSFPSAPPQQWYARIWRSISNLGQNSKDDPYMFMKVVITNQISVIILIVVLLLTYSFWQSEALPATIHWFLVLAAVVASVPLLNRYGHTIISRHVLGTALPLFAVLFVGHMRAIAPEDVHPASFYIPRFFQIGLSFLPLILFGFEERIHLFVSFTINVLVLLFFNELMTLMGAGMGMAEPTIKDPFFISVSSVLGLLIVSSGYFFLSRLNRKYEVMNKALLQQTELQNRNMQDAINYARNIHQVVLPAQKVVSNLLEQLFVVFRPLHVVSGDFYMVKESSDHILFSVIDCTGHGVPGAFVSILANSSIRRSIDLVGYSSPALILNNANRLFHEDLSRSGNPDIRDGMDMVMCALDKRKNELRLAGANLSAYVVSKNGITEYKTNKGGITMGNPERVFTTTTVILEKGDHVYLSSDGYYDQFGGLRDKRLGKRTFRSKLEEISSLPIADQSQELNRFFDEWKENSFQVDDVCLVGFRV